jgi:uncharacterized membrane protein
VSDNLWSEDGPAVQPAPVKGVIAAMLGLLLAGGVLLDVNRINSVRESLDRVAHLAAFEAAASPRSAERDVICQRRFAKTVWTDSEVSVDEIDVDVTAGSRGITATVTYDATVQLVVGRFFGFYEVVISGEAEVTAQTKQVATFTP